MVRWIGWVRSRSRLGWLSRFDIIRPLPVLSNQGSMFNIKAEVPEGGEENIELLDYLLYLRNNETEEEIVSELRELIFNVCSG